MWNSRNVCPLVVLVAATSACASARADLLLYEGFDAPVGTLDNKAGATSFGFHPDFGAVWDSGIYAAPNLAAGSIAPPPAVASFYQPTAVGNRVVEGFQSTWVERTTQVSQPHLYGSFLADIGLEGTFATSTTVNFHNFLLHAENPGNNSTAALWKVQTYGGTFGTGINAQGVSLVAWELQFDQANSLLPDTLRVWFNSNPLVAPPDFQSSLYDLGQNDLGGLTLTHNIYLGLSSAGFDEFRVGTDWSSVGISAVPEPGGPILLGLLLALAALRGCRTP